MFMNACSQGLKLDRAYPLWGEPLLLGADNNRPRAMQIRRPAAHHTAEACLLIVHGMNEYIGRYAHVADYFSERYIVAGIDLTGHGLSNPVFAQAQMAIKANTEKPDINDAFLQQAQLRNLNPMRDDLAQALHYLRAQCQQQQTDKPLPIFILSHSLGSLVSASYLLEMDDAQLKQRIGGIIFTGPAFSVTNIPGWRGWFQNPFVRFSYHTHQHFLNPHNEALPLMLFNQLLALISVPLQDGIIEFLSLPGLNQLFSPTTPDWVCRSRSSWWRWDYRCCC